jgi:peptidoglycan/LPS O-acetylase OafA/YrhL
VENNKLRQFDSLRGLAALVVVICHIHVGFNMHNATFGFSDIVAWVVNPTHTFFFGEVAVYLFFVLSGFVLSVGYFKSFERAYLYKLVAKRIPRLFLPVLATSFLYWLALRYNLLYHQPVIDINHSTWFARFWNQEYSLSELVINCTYGLFILNDRTICLNINSVLWTMPIEFVYSYILFVALFFVKNKRSVLIYDTLLLISVFTLDSHFYLLAFGLGLNIAYLYTHGRFALSKWWSFGFVAVAMVLATNVFGHFWGKELFFASGSACIVFVFAFNDDWAANFSSPFLVYLGKISFSLYLIHLLILATLSSRLYVFLYHVWGYGFEVTYAITFAFSLLVSFLSAILVYSWIEKPSLKLASLCADTIVGLLKKTR